MKKEESITRKSNDELNMEIDELNSKMFDLNKDGTIIPRDYTNDFLSFYQAMEGKSTYDKVYSLELIDKDWLVTNSIYDEMKDKNVSFLENSISWKKSSKGGINNDNK